MESVEWEYKLEGLYQSNSYTGGEWTETNGAGGYHTEEYVYKLLQSHLQKTPKPDYKNFRIWKRPKQNWVLVLNVAINGEGS